MEKEIVEMIEQRKETRNVDYKAPHAWDTESKAGLAKDIMAFSNTRDGGTLIIGISEKKDGSGYDIKGLTSDQLKTYDISSIGSYVNERCEPAPKYDVLKRQYQEKSLVIIQVSEFDSAPIICKKDAQKPYEKKDFIFKKGQILVRTDDAKSKPIQSAEEMHKLLGLAITKKGDELLQSIQRIIKGSPIEEPVIPPEKMYHEEIEKTKESFEEAFRDYGKDGFWEFVVYPLEYVEKRIDNYQELKDEILNATVYLRGGFPYHIIDRTIVSNLKNGVKGFTKAINPPAYELWHMYRSGYFISKQILMEDLYPEIKQIPGKTLEYTETIFRVIENLLFAKRLFEAMEYEGQIYYRISLGNCQDRELRSLFRKGVHFGHEYKCLEDKVEYEKQSDFDQFRSLWPEPSVDALTEIFALFNADQIPGKVIRKIVNGFLQRKF